MTMAEQKAMQVAREALKGLGIGWDSFTGFKQSAFVSALSLEFLKYRNEVLDEAHKVACDLEDGDNYHVATAIRRLKTKEGHHGH